LKSGEDFRILIDRDFPRGVIVPIAQNEKSLRNQAFFLMVPQAGYRDSSASQSRKAQSVLLRD
jgi:hypothetical protein